MTKGRGTAHYRVNQSCMTRKELLDLLPENHNVRTVACVTL
ncbi:hypothetical protein [Wolbachia endosymbiont of Cantharis cryptica]